MKIEMNSDKVHRQSPNDRVHPVSEGVTIHHLSLYTGHIALVIITGI